MKRDSGRARWRAGLLAAAGTVLLTAACSGGGGVHKSSPAGGSSRVTSQQMVALAQCLRNHGNPNAYVANPNISPPPPGLTIMGFVITGITPQSAQFTSAMASCKHLVSLPAHHAMTQQQKQNALKFAACMRAHGFPAYPDPQFQGNGEIEQPLPSSIDTASPQFAAAGKTCSAQS